MQIVPVDRFFLEQILETLKQANHETGYCCCGSSVDSHSFGDGHGPVDQGSYSASQVIEELEALIEKTKQ